MRVLGILLSDGGACSRNVLVLNEDKERLLGDASLGQSGLPEMPCVTIMVISWIILA
jgi:hypothetical protein